MPTGSLLSPLYTSAARLNIIEIKEVVHCLYICASRQLAVRCGFFHLENFLFFQKTARVFSVFSSSFHRYLDFPPKMVVYHITIHKYITSNWKTNCKVLRSIVKGLITGR